MPSLRTICIAQSTEFLYRLFNWDPVFSAFDLSSCNRVFTTQMGLVAVPVTTPAVAAANKCTHADSLPWLKVSLIIRLPLPYV